MAAVAGRVSKFLRRIPVNMLAPRILAILLADLAGR